MQRETEAHRAVEAELTEAAEAAVAEADALRVRVSELEAALAAARADPDSSAALQQRAQAAERWAAAAQVSS